MKLKTSFVFLGLFLAMTGKSFGADIIITGETEVNSSTTYTYYATPPTPIPPGTTYTWAVSATIVAENTDPNAGPLYVTIQWPAVLGQNQINIEDNNGNSGVLYITMYGFSTANIFKDPEIRAPFITGFSDENNGNDFPAIRIVQRLEAIYSFSKISATKKIMAVA